jgi:hypothetical protein
MTMKIRIRNPDPGSGGKKLVHIQNVERQNVDETKRKHLKTSTITKRRQLQNVEFFY